MAYAVYTDVQSEFKKLTFDADSVISSSEVTEWITQSENYINAKIGLKYSVPVSATDSPQSVSILKMVSIWLVADRIKEILTVRTGNSATEQTSDVKITYRDKAEKMLKDIVGGILPLPDATLGSTSDGVKSYSYTEAQSDTPQTFQRAVRQW